MRAQLCGGVLAAITFLAAPSIFAATPASGTLTPGSGPLIYTAGPFVASNPTPVPLVTSGPTCESVDPVCDSFELTISLPPGYAAANPGHSVNVTLSWGDTASGASDYDLYIYRDQVTSTTGLESPPYRSASGANPEVANIYPLLDGDTIYTFKVVPYTASAESLQVTIEILTGESGPLDPAFGGVNAVVPYAPRYFNIVPQSDVGAESSNGEMNIGFNPATGKMFAMAFLEGTVYRITTPDRMDPPQPEVCDSQWENVSPLGTSLPQAVGDPILWTDQATGRTFAANFTAGANYSYAWTPDDGDTWVDAGISPPAGADHETIGSGPYPEGSPYAAIAAAAGHPNAVYYCTQAVVGPGACQRSDNGGVSFGPPVLAYTGDLCGGLHGHVRVAPDGAAWLPVPVCGDKQGGSISTDAGDSWTEFTVPSSDGAAGSDPSVGLASDGTAYFCYINGDGHARVAVSRDRGATWADDFDLGAAHGVVNSAFPEAWAGDPDRAACGFLGTNQQGNFQSLDFPGVWYVFMAHTYDGGRTWTTVNATPHDPVQGVGGVWQGGGSEPNRNLLDFNEITVDEKGYALYGYDDGCVGACVDDPRTQSFTAQIRVARQIGGRSLYAAFDRPEPAQPTAPCLDGTRSVAKSVLNWREPDHGGDAIAAYRIYRAVDAESFGSEPIGTTGAKSSFEDRSVDPNVAKYFYKVTAVNGAGEGLFSNVIELPVLEEIVETACVLPGITLYTDPSADSTSSGVPGHEFLFASIAEPTDLPGKLVLTMKVDSLSPQPPPGSRWVTYYTAPDGSGERYIAMVTTDGLPTFEYGVKGTAADTVGTFTPDGTPDDTSNWSTDGTITIVLDKASLGFVDGSTITGLNSVVRTSSPADGAGLTVDSSSNGAYQLRGNANCALGSGPTDDPVDPPVLGGGSAAQDGNRFGGALGWLLLLPLAGALGLRRRLA